MLKTRIDGECYSGSAADTGDSAIAAFSRAVRTLVKRGWLHPVKSIVPVIATDGFEPLALADADYGGISGRWVRFVTREPLWDDQKSNGILNAYKPSFAELNPG